MTTTEFPSRVRRHTTQLEMDNVRGLTEQCTICCGPCLATRSGAGLNICPNWSTCITVNSTPHSSTGFSPFYLMFGREPRLPLDMFLGEKDEEWKAVMPSKWLADHRQRLRVAHHKAGETLRQQAQKRKQGHDQGNLQSDLRQGDLVITRRHLPGRNKIQDFWGEEVFTVTSVP